jgi:hypothetical protein
LPVTPARSPATRQPARARRNAAALSDYVVTSVRTACGVHSYTYFTPRVLEWLGGLRFRR